MFYTVIGSCLLRPGLCSASPEPDWTQHLRTSCWEWQCDETAVNSITQQALAGLWFLWFSHVPFKGSSSNGKSSLHSYACWGSEDSTWHWETHSLITFYSFLSATLSLIPCMWRAYSKSSDYIPWAHILQSLCPFSPLSLHRDFLHNLGPLYRLILCNGLY